MLFKWSSVGENGNRNRSLNSKEGLIAHIRVISTIRILTITITRYERLTRTWRRGLVGKWVVKRFDSIRSLDDTDQLTSLDRSETLGVLGTANSE